MNKLTFLDRFILKIVSIADEAEKMLDTADDLEMDIWCKENGRKEEPFGKEVFQ